MLPHLPDPVYVFEVDFEYNAPDFWDTARERQDLPPALYPLVWLNKDRIVVSAEEGETLREWCARLPGFAAGPAHAKTALRIWRCDRGVLKRL